MRKTLTLIALFAGVIVISSACKKKCTITPENTHTGIIVENVVLYPSSGYLTSNYNGSLHISAGHAYEDYFEISFDGGPRVPYTSVSGQYDILGQQRASKCEVYFDRDVQQDDVNNFVTYTVGVNECDNGCNETYVTENYVLIPKVPATHTVFFY